MNTFFKITFSFLVFILHYTYICLWLYLWQKSSQQLINFISNIFICVRFTHLDWTKAVLYSHIIIIKKPHKNKQKNKYKWIRFLFHFCSAYWKRKKKDHCFLYYSKHVFDCICLVKLFFWHNTRLWLFFSLRVIIHPFLSNFNLLVVVYMMVSISKSCFSLV